MAFGDPADAVVNAKPTTSPTVKFSLFTRPLKVAVPVTLTLVDPS